MRQACDMPLPDKQRRLPKVFYLPGGYISHSISGQSYQRQLAELGCLSQTLAEAEVVICHQGLRETVRTQKRIPSLRHKYQVGLLVWETDKLPADGVAACAAMAEIWTPSLYSARAFVRAHPQVYCIPHIIEPPVVATDADRRRVAAWLGTPGAHFNVLTVGTKNDPRKNIEGLRHAMARVRLQIPKARLVLKLAGADSATIDVYTRDTSLRIVGHASPAEMAALYEAVDMFASAHHAEGWGLGLSEAMAHGTLCLAPAYSGNLTFMHDNNAVLVPSRPGLVGQIKSGPDFHQDSTWGHPDPLQLQHGLAHAYALCTSGGKSDLVAQAKRDCRRFSPRRVRCLLRARLEAIAAHLDVSAGRVTL